MIQYDAIQYSRVQYDTVESIYYILTKQYGNNYTLITVFPAIILSI